MKRLVIDTETTGLSPNYNKTLTIGMLLVDVEKDFLDILDSNHLFIKHQNYNSSSEAAKVNKINIEEHDKMAIPPPEACEKINSFIEKNKLQETTLIGHNFQFDRGFINALFDQSGKNHKLHYKYEDTMWIWRNLQKVGNVPNHLRSNLQTIADFFKIDYTKAHDALADCHITAKVYKELIGKQ